MQKSDFFFLENLDGCCPKSSDHKTVEFDTYTCLHWDYNLKERKVIQFRGVGFGMPIFYADMMWNDPKESFLK
jgi:hypothetical protein